MSSSDDGMTVDPMVEANTQSDQAEGGGGEGVIYTCCVCPLCKGDLSEEYILVKRSSLDNFTICARCGYAWEKNKISPKRCPSCGTYKWADTNTQHECFRCGHTWLSRRGTRPSRCPSCRSTTWNRTDEDILERGIVNGMRMLDEIAGIADRHFSPEDLAFMSLIDSAVCRCALGEPVYDVAVDMSAPVLDILLELRARGIEYRMR